MKTIILLLVAATPALFAAESNPAPITTTNTVPALQVPLVEQAELVQQIGREAAGDFDTEVQAKYLRSRIEALLTPATAKVAAATGPTGTAKGQESAQPGPTVSGPVLVAAPAPMVKAGGRQADPAVLKEAIRKLRAMADELEAQVEDRSVKP